MGMGVACAIAAAGDNAAAKKNPFLKRIIKPLHAYASADMRRAGRTK
jgi:hypothetical protein